MIGVIIKPQEKKDEKRACFVVNYLSIAEHNANSTIVAGKF